MLSKIHLKKNEERRIKSGHLWIFSNEIGAVEGECNNGDLVEIFTSNGEFLGTGFYNKNSLISVRILSHSKIGNLEQIFRTNLISAYKLRKQFYPDRESFRMVFSESDFLPGLIIDKYNKTFVLQVYSFGMEKNVKLIVEILENEFGANNIFSRNENYFRKLEGLPEEDTIYLGEIKSEIISDGSIKYKIDFEKGHKTGFYFDQSDNRFFIEKLCKNKKVADLFCNSGGFGLHAVNAAASFVIFADSSAQEIENVKTNIELNGIKCPVDFEVTDIFDLLEKYISEKKKFDVVMIDPPAFAKSKKNLPKAKKGYEKLNKLAMQVINDNGFLVTSSCSHHLDADEFIQVVNSAASKANKKSQLLHFNGASLDHPELPGMDETAYLKFAVFRVNPT